MTVGELAVIMADIVVDKSDPLNVNFNKIFKNLPDEAYFRRELMYLKAFLVSFRAFDVSNSSNVNEASLATKLMVEKLEEYFASNDYDCNPNVEDLATAMVYYRNNFLEAFDYINNFPVHYKPNFEYDLEKLAARRSTNRTGEFFRFLVNKTNDKNFYLTDPYLFYRHFLGTYRQIKDILEEKTRSNNGGCYIATCVYGSYDCPEVWILRRFRDNILMKKWYGRAFVNVYYAISPTLVQWFGNTKWFNDFCKPKLDKMVSYLSSIGIKDTPCVD